MEGEGGAYIESYADLQAQLKPVITLYSSSVRQRSTSRPVREPLSRGQRAVQLRPRPTTQNILKQLARIPRGAKDTSASNLALLDRTLYPRLVVRALSSHAAGVCWRRTSRSQLSHSQNSDICTAAITVLKTGCVSLLASCNTLTSFLATACRRVFVLAYRQARVIPRPYC